MYMIHYCTPQDSFHLLQPQTIFIRTRNCISLIRSAESRSTLKRILNQRVEEIRRNLEVRDHHRDRGRIKVSYCNCLAGKNGKI